MSGKDGLSTGKEGTTQGSVKPLWQDKVKLRQGMNKGVVFVQCTLSLLCLCTHCPHFLHTLSTTLFLLILLDLVQAASLLGILF